MGTQGGAQFFLVPKGGAEKIDDCPSQIEGPLPVKNDTSRSELEIFIKAIGNSLFPVGEVI